MTLAIGQSSNPATTTSSSTASATTAGNPPALDENAFLQLLVAQLQHQDPTQPAQGTEFVTQLAQFAQLQQSVNQTSELTSMTAQMTGLSNNQTTDLVGQSVTMGGGTVSFDGSTATPSNVTLAAAAAQVTATITDSSGNTITTLNLGAEPAGPLNIQWNGQTQAGAAAPALVARSGWRPRIFLS